MLNLSGDISYKWSHCFFIVSSKLADVSRIYSGQTETSFTTWISIPRRETDLNVMCGNDAVRLVCDWHLHMSVILY